MIFISARKLWIITFIGLYLNLNYHNVFAACADKECQNIPSYSVILNAQFKCDDSELKKIPWDKRYRDIWKLAYKSWSVISDLEIVEEHRKQKKGVGPHRDFRITFTPYARLICGEESEIVAEKKIKKEITLPVVEHAFKRPGFFDVADNDDELPMTEGSYHSYLFYEKYSDEPNPKGMEGLSCLVKLEDLIKNPLKAVDIGKICKGESKKKIELTKKEILRVASVLKQRMDKKKLDKK